MRLQGYTWGLVPIILKYAHHRKGETVLLQGPGAGHSIPTPPLGGRGGAPSDDTWSSREATGRRVSRTVAAGAQDRERQGLGPLPKLERQWWSTGAGRRAPANRARRMQVKRHFSWLPMQWLMQWEKAGECTWPGGWIRIPSETWLAIVEKSDRCTEAHSLLKPYSLLKVGLTVSKR